MNTATRRRIGIAVVAIVVAVIAVLGIAALVDRPGPKPAPVPAPSAILSPAPITPSVTGAAWEPAPPALPDGVTYAYARIDTTNGSLQLGGDVERRPLGRLIVPGLAQDYLHQLSQSNEDRTAEDERQIREALAGDTTAIGWLTDQVGGTSKSFTRITDVCELDDTSTDPPAASPLDIARYGGCLAAGAITDDDGAVWVLEQMRATRSGIGESRGDAALSQQNSVVLDDSVYQAGCLAIGPWWVATVLVDYDQDRGEPYGRAVCALVADGLFPPDTEKVPEKTSSPAPSVDAS